MLNLKKNKKTITFQERMIMDRIWKYYFENKNSLLLKKELENVELSLFAKKCLYKDMWMAIIQQQNPLQISQSIPKQIDNTNTKLTKLLHLFFGETKYKKHHEPTWDFYEVPFVEGKCKNQIEHLTKESKENVKNFFADAVCRERGFCLYHHEKFCKKSYEKEVWWMLRIMFSQLIATLIFGVITIIFVS